MRGSYEGMIRQSEKELHGYDQLKFGDLKLPNIDHLDGIAPFIVKLRISKDISQTELGQRLGVSQRQ